MKDTKTLATKIVNHIVADLFSMRDLGDIEFQPKNLSKQEVFALFNAWIPQVENMIIGSTSDGEEFKAFFDGSAKPNPGIITIGGYVDQSDGYRCYEYSRELEHGTNNEAEYKSFNYLLKRLIEKGVKNVAIYGDSSLVVNQVNGTWKARDARMIELRDAALKKLRNIPKWTLEHVPRAMNKDADKLTR